MAAVKYGSLPFDEQARFFRGKLNLDTNTWADIRKDAHARAFVVAGARGQVVAGFRAAIDKAITSGTTLADFRKDFDEIVSRNGWSYNGGRAWRSRVIYDTNLRTSYAAGRYRQLQAVKQTRPYWRFVHTPVANPREQHVAWDGLVLPADDPWWRTHYPPDGWGCQCKVHSLSERDLTRLGKEAPDTPPADGTYVVARGPFAGHRVPVGIDPGWDYNVGRAAWGEQLQEREWASAKASGKTKWVPLRTGPLTEHDWQSLGRPADIPLDKPTASLARPLDNAAQVTAQLKTLIGADQKVFDLHGLPALVNAEALGAHIDPARATYLPLLPETLTDPFEVWIGFMRQPATGKVALRARIIKAFDVGPGRGVVAVMDAQNGALSGYTFVAPERLNYLRNQRWGFLLYGRDDEGE